MLKLLHTDNFAKYGRDGNQVCGNEWGRYERWNSCKSLLDTLQAV